MKTDTFKVGDKVHYDNGHGRIENGIVKSLHDKWSDRVFVVYHCDEKWDQYQKYTGHLTNIDSINHGWK